MAPEDSGGAGAFFIQFDKKKKGKRGKKKKGNRPGAATPKAKPSEPIPFLQRSNSENRTDPEEEEQRPQPTRPESAVASE
ncbi:MAG: hypothetical protein V2I33_20330, partial [Kangiellaceae bacterium]|nr:hypothetical protein [Kangiellaceae bacterium]